MRSFSVVVYFFKETSCNDTPSCYCPAVGACEIYRYKLNLNALVKNNTHIGQHNREYIFTIMAINNAKLRDISRIDILVDDSPPVAGVVIEGATGTPDIDYSSGEEIIVSWDGFIDHESGIKLYKIGFDKQCFPIEYFMKREENATFVSYQTSLKVKSHGSGAYFTTVVAFNNAMEPSIPVCSDGIIFDDTPPNVSDIRVEHLRATEIIGCLQGDAFLILENLTAIPLQDTQKCSNACNTSIEMDLISFLPIAYSPGNDTDVADDLCSRLPSYDHNWAMYLPSDKVYMNYKVSDAESQIGDVQIGFAFDPSWFADPDIIGFDSSHTHTRFTRAHTGINRGMAFYIILNAVNKADLSTIIQFGPIIIDETPPFYGGSLKIDIHENFIYCIWNNKTFVEMEERGKISQILFRIGTCFCIG